jgi:hypothetical protein
MVSTRFMFDATPLQQSIASFILVSSTGFASLSFSLRKNNKKYDYFKLYIVILFFKISFAFYKIAKLC